MTNEETNHLNDWFCVTVCIGLQTTSGERLRVSVTERFFLVEATSYEDAKQVALPIVETYCLAEEGSHICGEPATVHMLGIRKITKVENIFDGSIGKVTSGVEVCESYYEVDTLEDAFKLGRGEAVRVIYCDDAEYDYADFPLPQP
jgi:hypothetical protein